MSWLVIAIVLAAANSAANQVVPWLSAQSAIADTICVVPEARAPDGYFVSFGYREACALAPASSPIERAVDAGFNGAMPLLVNVPPAFELIPSGIEKAYAPDDPAERNRIAREMLVGREELLRALIPRLVNAMAAEGLSCADCPTFPNPPVRKVTWKEFFPYVMSFVSPDPVKSLSAAEGQPPGRATYSFHICSGLNPGLTAVTPDAALLRAGFVAAFATRILRPQTGEHFTDILNEKAFGELTTDDARTDYLRTHITEALRRDRTVRHGVCETLKSYGPDLGIKLAECSP